MKTQHKPKINNFKNQTIMLYAKLIWYCKSIILQWKINFKKWAKDLNIFLQIRYTNSQFAYENIFNILVIREMQTKTTMRASSDLLEWLLWKKKSKNNKCWWRCGKTGTLMHCWSEECKVVQQSHFQMYTWMKWKEGHSYFSHQHSQQCYSP